MSAEKRKGKNIHGIKGTEERVKEFKEEKRVLGRRMKEWKKGEVS